VEAQSFYTHRAQEERMRGVVFQACGQGQREASLLVPTDEAAARETIEAELGDLRHWHIEPNWWRKPLV
jgi:hypothetical protein